MLRCVLTSDCSRDATNVYDHKSERPSCNAQTFMPEAESPAPLGTVGAYFLIIEERDSRRFDLPDAGQLVIGREERSGVNMILIQHRAIFGSMRSDDFPFGRTA